MREEDELSKIKHEIEQIDHDLQNNGGINCGWDDSDHKDFLRIRTKHNNKTGTVGFMTELMRAVPNIDEDSTREHV